ncbi:molybdate-binding protein [Marmoricola endophyticus]|uniref:Molybdate-binding protein n=1 Tax=Marmoricola endophyticus TaxID=2040280 RepID=A0A917BTY2_9ACTN|nr:molybdate ABC transporter substrate-binding protein [Marmoricola endophyticus]GGF54336.1 molybdate-binding protein [Marmoricola endophyticus]
MKPSITPRLWAPVLALAMGTSLAACGSGGDDEAGSGDDQTLTVLAAASLTESFTDLKKEFEADHEGVKVKLVFDSSAALAELAEQGAPGDVLATADKRTMDEAEANDGTGSDPQQFATNVVTLAVPSANPGKITSFADIAKPGVSYVVCVPSAPCGAASQTLLKSNKITAKPASEETDVKAVLAKVTANEADAGLVYATDVTSAGDDVKGIEVPGAAADPNTYWVAQTSNAKAKDLAGDWIDLMRGADGKKVLTAAGFGTS